MKTIFNKKASFEYFLKEKLETGIVLTGAEIKSVREGAGSLADSFVRIVKDEVTLFNAFISPYKYAFDPSYDPKRERKLLLKRKEIDFLIGKLTSSNLTIVPTKLYITHNLVKLEIALALPKKKFDKRDSLKRKAVDRQTESLLRAEKRKANSDSK
ncbi:MAG: SsrA-binding protein SmpB [bacterium]|nr:SsrA-binding protein SmpB [bacterium]